MADNCGCLIFDRLVGDKFYFKDFEEDEVDTDTFEFSRTMQNLIRCPDSRFLILNDANQFDLKWLNSQEQRSSDYKFNISLYKDLSTQSNYGRAVMLYASSLRDDKKYAAVCKNQNEVGAEEVKEPNQTINESKHKAVFYLIQDQQPDKFKFRSSLFPDRALGFDEYDSHKLVLCPYNPESQTQLIQLE